MIIPIGILAPASGKYTISALELNFKIGVNVFLIDKEKNKRINLNENPDYTFRTSKINTKDRFEIIFKLDKNLKEEKNDELSDIEITNSESVNIYSDFDKVYIKLQNISGNNNTVIIQDVVGRKIIEKRIAEDFIRIDMQNYASGTYIIKLKTENKIYEEKVFIR